jgi:hypothetical protein
MSRRGQNAQKQAQIPKHGLSELSEGQHSKRRPQKASGTP